jgi:hypothetical protein
MKEFLNLIINKAMENFFYLMEKYLKGLSNKIWLMDKEHWVEEMEVESEVIGEITS